MYKRQGTDNAIDEAAALVLHALHLPPDLHTEYFQSYLTPSEKQAALHLLERRVAERKPAAYLTNRAWFMSLPFYVDERVPVSYTHLDVYKRQVSNSAATRSLQANKSGTTRVVKGETLNNLPGTCTISRNIPPNGMWMRW